MAALVKRMFSKYPLLCNSVVYGTLYTGAEFSQQTITKKVMVQNPQPYDVGAMTRYCIFGTAFTSSYLYYWYRWLDSRFVGTAGRTVVKKLLLDQFLMTPPLLVAFYISMSLMERKTDLLEECREKLIPTFKSSCMFWLPAQTLNFVLVPPAARVVYVGSCALIWVNILCWFKRQDY